jgi:uncharacterized protein
MRLYADSSQQFVRDATQNYIAEKLRDAFLSQYRYQPSPGEVQSWRNSLRALSLVIQYAGLTDHGILLEYQLPLTSRRLDCMIVGKDGQGADHAVIVELKQWEECEASDGDNELTTWLGGAPRDVLHPSVQVGQYHTYLQDMHTAFYQGDAPVTLHACAYLHNYAYDGADVLFAPKFAEALQRFPVFTADDVDALSEYLGARLGGGDGMEVLRRVEQSRYRPSKKLMNHVGELIKGKEEYVLLDEQLLVYDRIFALAREGFQHRKKHAVIIKGGPGTGKSVIALNVMADLLLAGINAHYATGSKAFTETLQAIIGSRGAAQFKYFMSYVAAQPNEVDVLICDEAHRIRASSVDRFKPASKRSGLPQVDELLRAAKVTVFFVDDFQGVRPNEIGSTSYLKTAAEKAGARVHEYALEAQFRCSGSDAFVNWIDNSLGIRRTANVIWDQHETFEFRIFGSPDELESAIRQKASEGVSARVTAGFCWNWSAPNPDGTLVEDVVIGGYRRPWNAKPKARRLARGIPKASLWAHDPGGIDQVGCVYTAQGFDFDYVGVIFGPDLTYDFDAQGWTAHRDRSADRTVRRSRPEEFRALVKNTYRVLLTRGLKGCYVYFADKDTERFFKSRIEATGAGTGA